MKGIDMADYWWLCNMFMLALSFSLSSSLYCQHHHHHHQRHNNIDSRRFYLFIIIIISSSSSSISNTSSRTSSTTTIVLQLVYAPVWCCCCCCCCFWFRRMVSFSPLVTCRIGSSSYCYSYFRSRNQYRIWFERNSVASRPSVSWYQFCHGSITRSIKR